MATKERTVPSTLKGVTNTEWPINQNTEKVFDLKSKVKSPSKGEQFLTSEPLEYVKKEDLVNVGANDLQVEKVVTKPATKTKALAKPKNEITTRQRKAKSTTSNRQFTQLQKISDLDDKFIGDNNVADEKALEQMLISNQQTLAQKAEEEMKFMQLIQLASLGLYKLFLKGSSNLLNPLAFLVENKEILFKAAWILVMPMLFTTLAFSTSASLAAKVTDVNMALSATYYTVFYFATLFVWVSSLVMLKGVYHMFRKTLIDVARKEQV